MDILTKSLLIDFLKNSNEFTATFGYSYNFTVLGDKGKEKKNKTRVLRSNFLGSNFLDYI
jgi:hypothetical protein